MRILKRPCCDVEDGGTLLVLSLAALRSLGHFNFYV